MGWIQAHQAHRWSQAQQLLCLTQQQLWRQQQVWRQQLSLVRGAAARAPYLMPYAGTLAPAGTDFEAAGPDFEAAGPDSEVAGPDSTDGPDGRGSDPFMSNS